MADIIFCTTDFYLKGGYASYGDFFRLAELSGYPVIPLAQLDPDDASKTYIVTPLNGEWTQGWRSPKARIIHWELEWRTDWRADVDTPPGIAETWTMDRAYAQRIGAKYVPIGSHPSLAGYWDTGFFDRKWITYPPAESAPQYAACFLSYMVHRRQHVANQLAGLAIAPHDNLWGQRRHEVLSQTRALIHVHQHEHVRGIACLRWAIAAAYSLPIISETVDDWGIFGHSHMLTSDYAHLPRFIQMWLGRNEARVLEDFGRALHGLLCRDKTFKKVIEANV